MRLFSPPRPRPGFTLIELLVVMAILGLLMGMLLAAVSRAREAAIAVQTKHRLKELGLAMHIYHDANKNFPPMTIDNPDGTKTRWMNMFFKDIYKVEEPMKDPSVPEWSGVGRNTSFGYNYKYLGSLRANATSPTAPYERFPVTFWKIESPTMTIAFGASAGTGTDAPYPGANGSDVTKIGNHGYTLDPTFIPSWSENNVPAGAWSAGNVHCSYLAERHMGRGLVCFVDGHVDSVDLRVVYRDNSFWNGYGQPDPRDSISTTRPANDRYRP